MSAEVALLACLVAFGLAFTLTMISNLAFYWRLKRHEYEVWVSLGSPMPLVNLDTHNFAAVRRFLAARRHLVLQDRTSAKLGRLVVLTDRVFLGTIAVAVLVVACIAIFVEP